MIPLKSFFARFRQWDVLLGHVLEQRDNRHGQRPRHGDLGLLLGGLPAAHGDSKPLELDVGFWRVGHHRDARALDERRAADVRSGVRDMKLLVDLS